jgi:glycosyltransferase involved in cell wall biosynthesis
LAYGCDEADGYDRGPCLMSNAAEIRCITVIIPVFNEAPTLRRVIGGVLAASVSLQQARFEVVIVDDGSTDGTRGTLSGVEKVRIVTHARNLGKGAAVRTGLALATGEILLVQDADLEYDPSDYKAMLEPLLAGTAKVVFGSRVLTGRGRMPLISYFGNRLVTALANAAFGTSLTDVETGYKAWAREVSPYLALTQPRWGFDPEVAGRIAAAGYEITEVPISYTPRRRRDGKKLGWADSIQVIGSIVRFGRLARSSESS